MLSGYTLRKLKWVLQAISFIVNLGEAVGIIGINGAGKSTLLKMITGTSQPTAGSVQITGRVAALLELGMGFHLILLAGRTSSWLGNCWATALRKSIA